MLKITALDHFKSEPAIARALKISRTAVYKWGDVIPEGSAYKIESITGGVLRVDPSLYPPRRSAGTAEKRA
jgi:hypothetical protein